MQTRLDTTMAPLFWDCVIFSSNTENGFTKAVLFVSKVSVANSYTHLENLLDWTADIFFAATHGKLEPFDSDVAKQRVSRNSVYPFFLLMSVPSSHSIPGVRKKIHPFTRSTLPFEKKEHPFSKFASVKPFYPAVRKKFTSIQPFNLKCYYDQIPNTFHFCLIGS